MKYLYYLSINSLLFCYQKFVFHAVFFLFHIQLIFLSFLLFVRTLYKLHIFSDLLQYYYMFFFFAFLLLCLSFGLASSSWLGFGWVVSLFFKLCVYVRRVLHNAHRMIVALDHCIAFA